jgi:hypothetical protein
MEMNKGYTELSDIEFIAGSDQYLVFNTELNSSDITNVEWILKSNSPYNSTALIQKTLSSGVIILENGAIQVKLDDSDTSELKGKYLQYITIDTASQRYRPAKGYVIINEY